MKSIPQQASVFDQAVDGIALIDPDGQWLSVNQRFCERIGQDPAVLTRSPFSKQFKPDDPRQARSTIFRPSSGLFNFMDQQIYLQISPVYDPDGSLLCYSIFAQNPSRVLLDGGFIGTDQQLRELIVSVYEAICLVGPDGDIQAANEQMASWFDIPLDQFLGKILIELTPADASRTWRERIDLVARSGQPVKFQETLKNRLIEFTLSPIFNQAHAVEKISIIGKAANGDHYEQKDLAASEKRFRAGIEALTEGFAILSPVCNPGEKIVDFRIEYMNEIGLQLNRLKREDIEKHTLLDLLPNHEPDEVFHTLMEVVDLDQPLSKEVRIEPGESAGQPGIFDFRAARVEDSFIVTWRDISQKKAAADLETRHTRELSFLYDTSLEVTAKLNLTNLLRSILDRAAMLLGTPLGGLYMVEPGGDSLELVVSHNLPLKYSGLHLKIGEGVAGQVALTGEVVSIPDYMAWPGHAQAYEDALIHRILGIPLKSGGFVIGVIDVADDENTGSFSDEQVRLAILFADQAAIAIENAHLYEAIQHELVERQKAEENLRLAAKVLETTAEGLFITDAASNIISVNHAFTQITGYEREEVIGKNALEIHRDANDVEYFTQTWAMVAATGQWQGEITNRRKDGDVYPEWVTISTIRNSRGDLTNYVCIFTDITLRKQTEKRLRHLATHDGLTDLPNRELFRDRLDHAIMRTRRNATGKSMKWQGAVMLLDLDHFKQINDTYGHARGDQILQIVSDELSKCVRSTDTVARMGGDEFTLVLEEVSTVEDSRVVAEKIRETLAKPVEIEDQVYHITCSIGISLFPQQGEDSEQLLKQADIAMYRAKEKRNCYCIYPNIFG
jgi:diguanylate cyclase (GGDEF)-like protein/PAS domain S-box-containing protein